ncbi:siderophore ABC transporter substrate-binding protein [Corynebacterium glyciniphilum]|uniref:siderophore ABC transporter substrate-binding protein n=1 Tax=Corynebacterium glyciniphilum TaxID=1404244 RepID=UPI003DA02C79
MRITLRRTSSRALAVSMTAVLSMGALAACSSDDDSDSGNGDTRTVTDARGEVEIPAEPERVAAFDNRIFQVLEDWDIDLVSAPVDLIPDTITKYHDDTEIRNTGNHNEPNLEELVASEPDLIITGYRYASYYDEMKDLLPDVPVIDLSFGENFENEDAENELPLEERLKDITSLIGEVFGKEDEANALESDFDEAKERAAAAYNADETVMGVVVSGGNINYAAPVTGRSVGPVFEMLGLTPALDQDGSGNHQGDDISIEQIAASNPDWILVLDRDAGVNSEEDAQPAAEIIADSPALTSVPAVENDNIVYFPSDFYTTEDIEAYTEVLNNIADAFEDHDAD